MATFCDDTSASSRDQLSRRQYSRVEREREKAGLVRATRLAAANARKKEDALRCAQRQVKENREGKFWSCTGRGALRRQKKDVEVERRRAMEEMESWNLAGLEALRRRFVSAGTAGKNLALSRAWRLRGVNAKECSRR